MSTESEPETSGRRRFLRKAVGLTAAGGIATLLYGGTTQKPLIEVAQAASGGNMIIDAANDGESGTTSLSSSGNPTLLGINTSNGAAIQGTSSVGSGILGTTDSGIGVSGVTSGSGTGVQGWAIAESGVGVEGIANAPNTAGVRGVATASSGDTTAGVEGYASGTDGMINGVYGHTDSPRGCGVWGYATANTGNTAGVIGNTESPIGAGVLGEAFVNGGVGVLGYSRGIVSGAIPIVAWAASGQTAPLQEWWNYDRTPLAVVGKDGSFGIGTSNPQAKLHVSGTTPNILMGDASNTISPDVIGGTISGGGAAGYGNKITDDYDTVGGGWNNTVSGATSTVSGGGMNKATGVASTVGGGAINTASGVASTVPGGQINTAAADYSFAAGTRSKVDAAHTGAFLFADGNDFDFNSVTVNEFAVRCTGGARFVTAIDGSTGNPTMSLAMTPAGNMGIGTTNPVRQLHIRGSNAVARLDRNVDSASFIFVRTSADFSQVLKTFTFGVKASGVNNGSFFIGDMHTNVSGSSDNRLLIDTNGNVGIGTTTPSSKLHVSGRVKALGYDTGDITFANGYKLTEDPHSGMLLVNQKGENMARFDEQGNLHIKGDIIKDL